MIFQLLVPILGRSIKQHAWLRWSLRLAALVGIATLVDLGMPGQFSISSNVAVAQDQTPIDRTVVETGSLNITLNAAGSLSPAQQLELTFESSALVAEVFVTEGQRVKKGDILARLDSTDAEAAVRDAEITLA